MHPELGSEPVEDATTDRGSWRPSRKTRVAAAGSVVLAIVLLGVAYDRIQAAVAGTAPVPSTDRDQTLRNFDLDCMRSGCHGGLNETPWVHGPVAVGGCAACHLPLGPPDAHQFRFTGVKAELCTHCHTLRESHREFQHSAIEHDGCTGCHDPHGGQVRRLLPSSNPNDLCSRCHQPTRPKPASGTLADWRAQRPFKTLHPPVAESQCVTCHEVHAADHPGLTVASQPELCFACHAEFRDALAAATHVHEPAKQDCSRCHAPHGSDQGHLLVAASKTLCLDCHDKVAASLAHDAVELGDAVTNGSAADVWSTHRNMLGDVPLAPPATATAARSTELHGAIGDADTCLTCHEPHAGEGEHLMRGALGETCLSCHGREIRLASGRVIPDIRGAMEHAVSRHAPVAEGECVACHRGHTSEQPFLLTAAYRDDIYVPFDEESYALCFSCHDRALAADAITTATHFRDGTRNLHYVHLRDELIQEDRLIPAASRPAGAMPQTRLIRGRGCGVCHDVHAGAQAHLLRESVPYGPMAWPLEIRFEARESGGTCMAGCHQQKTYDRGPSDPARAPRVDPTDRPR